MYFSVLALISHSMVFLEFIICKHCEVEFKIHYLVCGYPVHYVGVPAVLTEKKKKSSSYWIALAPLSRLIDQNIRSHSRLFDSVPRVYYGFMVSFETGTSESSKFVLFRRFFFSFLSIPHNLTLVLG